MSDFDSRAHANALISDLGTMLGDPLLAFDEDDYCAIGAGTDMPIEIIYAQSDTVGLLLLATVVGEIDLGDRSEVFTEALRANLYGRGTGGAALSLREDDHICMHKAIAVEPGLGLPELQSEADSLVEATTAWRIYLDAHQPEPIDLPDADEDE